MWSCYVFYCTTQGVRQAPHGTLCKIPEARRCRFTLTCYVSGLWWEHGEPDEPMQTASDVTGHGAPSSPPKLTTQLSTHPNSVARLFGLLACLEDISPPSENPGYAPVSRGLSGTGVIRGVGDNGNLLPPALR